MSLGIDKDCAECLRRLKRDNMLEGHAYQCESCPYGVIIQEGKRVYTPFKTGEDKGQGLGKKNVEIDRELE